MNTRLSIYKMLLFLCVISLAAGSLWSSPDIEAQLRLYEGFKVRMPAPAKVITSYYLKPISDKNIQSDVDIDKEKNSLKKVFNLKDIKIITKAAMVLSEDGKSPFQVIVLNGRKLLLQLNPLKNQKNRFKVEVMETDIASGSLLKTQIHLPEKKTTVLGFKDSSGKIYFLSFHRGKDVQPLSSKDIKNITANKQPKLVKSVPPKYPKAAIKAGISGSIMINATTDATGKVVDVDVIVGPKELRQAAVDAIKQWVYKPYILDNEPTPVRFTVIVKFNLDSKKKKKEPLAISSKKRPKLIKNPPPKYPEKALKECIAGKVVMEAITDEHGRVVSAKVLDGHPELRQAAVGAIKKWVYEPYVLDGVAEPVKFTVIINFKLDNDKNKSNTEESIKLSFKQRPKVIKRVPPVYPKKALKTGVSGNVVIEVTCDKKGNVAEATIVEGIPLLNNAALDSIKKWTYEPYLVDGEAKRVSFTVVVKFNLK